MSFKEKAIAALEEMKRLNRCSDSVIQATIDDCIRMIRELPEDDSRYTRLIERNQEEYHKLKEENEALRSYYDGLKQAHALACAQLDMVRLIFGGNR